MHVSVEQTGALERRLTVQVPASEVQARIDARLKEIGRKVRIKGFRPGRIPASVLQQRYGKQVRQEVFAETMQTTLSEALQQESLRPVVQPRVDETPDFDGSNDFQYTAVVEVYPELDTIDVGDVALSMPQAEVTDQDVDEMIVTLQQQRQEWKPAERAAGAGDRVTIEYVANVDGQRVPETGHQELPVVIGQSGFEALDEALTGMNAGDEKKVSLTFPGGYREPKLAGQTAEVTLTAARIEEAELPEVDEAFARSFGIESGDVETLRREVRANLERELRQAMTSLRKVRLIEALVAEHPELEVPDSLVRSEARDLQARAAQSQQGEAPQVDAFLDTAAQRVRAGMLISELAVQNDIHVDDQRVRGTIEELANTYEQSDQVLQMYYNDQRLLQNVQNAVLEEQVVDWAMDHAKVTPEPMTFRDVIAAATRSA